MNNVLERIRNGLVVSCQALEDEPLHGPILMGAMALAAREGGAVGIRANGERDIKVIKEITGLPVIGIEKHNSSSGEVLITPNFACAKRLAEAGADIVSIDACLSHPREIPLSEFIARIKSELGCLVMADISNLQDALEAEKSGADLVASTYGWVGGEHEAQVNWNLISALTDTIRVPVIAEGGIWSPEEAVKAIKMGAFAVVVGTAITRPQLITRRFVSRMETSFGSQ